MFAITVESEMEIFQYNATVAASTQKSRKFNCLNWITLNLQAVFQVLISNRISLFLDA